MPDVTHLSPQQQRIFNLLQRADKLIGAMMPGVRHIALQNYAELNNVPLDIGGMLRELSDPATTDWTQERVWQWKSMETATGADLDKYLFGITRPAGMTDLELRDILRNRTFADLASGKAWKEWSAPRSGPGHPAHNDVMEATAGLEDAMARAQVRECTCGAALDPAGGHDDQYMLVRS